MVALNTTEMELWQAWRSAAEAVRVRVAEDIARATGLSDPDFGVLARVSELGGGRLRQNELAASMGWHRSRLSHHLTRMAQRGLITRVEVDGGVEVVVTDRGDELHAVARPIHAEAVRRHLLDAIPPALQDDVRSLLARLAN
ncbi:MarR family winged helix-turn-helix transcriptional regulator [Actinomadura fibrosa]|uniref:MarR family winged helix-turn-helix transcriptional regulator n=1 Tax=Actinomadura fibrosa TaxID=111802 RepID=A0ABW2XAM9_9ACTN|nr:MarR family transcriptional regulator [Actinomadura fibrosa]